MSGEWIAQLEALGEPSDAAIAGALAGDGVREAVLDVLCGRNVRARTEVATRRRLLAEQAQLISGLLRLESSPPAGAPALLTALAGLVGPTAARRATVRTRLLRLVGLPKKTLDNLTNRGEERAGVAADYVGMVDVETARAREQLAEALGDVQITVGGAAVRDPLGLLLTLTTAAGATALSTRGSDKSANGKALERAMLGAVLRMFGLRQVTPGARGDGVFWLSHLEDGGREADATVLLPGGHAVRIDVGFIGEGNPEVTKDKLSRYARQADLGGTTRDVATVVIADKLSEGSTTWQVARDLEATLVQMSDPGWVLALREALLRAGLPAAPSAALVAELRAAADAQARRDVLDRHLPAVTPAA